MTFFLLNLAGVTDELKFLYGWLSSFPTHAILTQSILITMKISIKTIVLFSVIVTVVFILEPIRLANLASNIIRCCLTYIIMIKFARIY